MLTKSQYSLEAMIDALKAIGESTRLRILVLLNKGDLTVTDLTDILGQSQPRISRHLKLLTEARLIERYQEGAWAYFRLTYGENGHLVRNILSTLSVSDPSMVRDVERLNNVKIQRAKKAQNYFSKNAAHWDELRRLHISEANVEAELLELLGATPFSSMLDLGTGTGRILQILSPLYREGIGVDASRDMLTIARANLDAQGITHASVRTADILNLPMVRESFELVTIHQVLHYLPNPEAAIAEAVRMLSPGGRLVVVDFAAHSLDYLRDEQAHIRLGFTHAQITDWVCDNGLVIDKIVDLKPENAKGEKLTVTLWLASDPRILVAGSENTDSVGV